VAFAASIEETCCKLNGSKPSFKTRRDRNWKHLRACWKALGAGAKGITGVNCANLWESNDHLSMRTIIFLVEANDKHVICKHVLHGEEVRFLINHMDLTISYPLS
jgi:hypothetical protein